MPTLELGARCIQTVTAKCHWHDFGDRNDEALRAPGEVHECLQCENWRRSRGTVYYFCVKIFRNLISKFIH